MSLRERIKRFVSSHDIELSFAALLILTFSLAAFLAPYLPQMREAAGIQISIEQCDPTKVQAICREPKELNP